jgi:hypothetical protein
MENFHRSSDVPVWHSGSIYTFLPWQHWTKRIHRKHLLSWQVNGILSEVARRNLCSSWSSVKLVPVELSFPTKNITMHRCILFVSRVPRAKENNDSYSFYHKVNRFHNVPVDLLCRKVAHDHLFQYQRGQYPEPVKSILMKFLCRIRRKGR